MSRYIKFDDAVKVMACEMYAEAQSQGYDVDGIEDFMPEAKAWLNDAPSIDIEPKRGEWIYGEHDVAMCDGYRCNRCDFFVPWDYEHKFIDFINDYHFCPNCGADMREVRDE